MMTKKQIRSALERFERDKSKVVSLRLFCDLAGISLDTYKNLRADKYEMSEMVQIRLERALGKMERGEVKVMHHRDRTNHIAYRKVAEPEFKRGLSLTLKNGRIAIKTGLQNANNYRRPTFEEEFDGHS